VSVRALLPASLLVLGLLALAQPAAAQTHTCGDIQIVFRNPDLQPRDDGFIHASGQFFAQFQAIGAGADQIATFGFSFGPETSDFDESACGAPAWVTGTYVPNYRADRDASDGFFIPLKTSLVPDGTYAAAVHAYDAQDNELARFWGKAVVDNCDDAPGAARCDGDAAQNIQHDTTAPWPMVLPGDGQPLDGHQFTIEFAEPLSSYLVLLNGQDITANMTEWDGRLWDADLVPGYGPAGAGAVVAPECSLPDPAQQCIKYGPAYEWKGRALTDTDVLRVEATDLAGNRAVKDIHIGSSVAGGAITDGAPNLQITVDETRKTTTPGQAAVFRFQITNTGGGTAHPFTSTQGPDGWDVSFTPHKPVPAGGSDTQELTAVPPATAAAGDYTVNATISYPEGGTQKDNRYQLTVTVDGSAQPAQHASTAPETKAKSSPGLASALALAAVGVAAALRRRS
jgi:MYXO-CTERM domain-containing protein